MKATIDKRTVELDWLLILTKKAATNQPAADAAASREVHTSRSRGKQWKITAPRNLLDLFRY